MQAGIWRVALIAVLAALAVTAVFLLPPVPQDPSYHAFADARTLFGVPNFWNVMSNAAFLCVGVWGIVKFAHRGGGAVPAFSVFCIGVALVALGSAYYHLDPTPQRLLWDRLPMTVAFMALFSMVIADCLSPRLGLRLLWPLVLAGVASVVYWYWTEVQGMGDLRPYVLVQFLPLMLIPLMLLLFPGGAIDAPWMWITLVAYALAKIAEYFDAALFGFTGFWSGHTLKHLLAAAAVMAAVRACRDIRVARAPKADS